MKSLHSTVVPSGFLFSNAQAALGYDGHQTKSQLSTRRSALSKAIAFLLLWPSLLMAVFAFGSWISWGFSRSPHTS